MAMTVLVSGFIVAGHELAHATQGYETLCVVDVADNDVLNVRNRPTVRGSINFVIPPNGCGISVVGPCSGIWCPIAWSGHQGWANTKYIGVVPLDTGSPLDQGSYDDGGGDLCVAVPADDVLNARAGPSVDYPVIGAYASGTCGIITTGYCLGDWCETEAERFTGWVNTRYLERY